MSKESVSHGEYNHGLTQAALLRRRSNGPWARETREAGGTWKPASYPGSRIDWRVQETLDERELAVSAPNPMSSSVAERLFYHVPNAQYSYYGQLHTYDLITSAEFLEPGTRRPKESLPNWQATTSYEAALRRIDLAQWRGERDSTDALTVLHNVARKFGKIGYVSAHGGTRYGEWHVAGDDFLSAPIDDVIHDLASQKDQDGQPKYYALFFNACNDGGFAPDMKGIDIPVIAFTNVNTRDAQGNVKVYLPPKQINEFYE